jgi:hypothetical protein
MNARRFIVVVMVACLPVVLLAALDAPTGLTVSGDDPIELEWNPVADAAKYSVDIEGLVTYWTTILVDDEEVPFEAQAEVGVSFGTSDRTDGLEMSEPSLTISIEALADAIADALGVDAGDLVSLDGSAKVKALDPGKGKGPQNNPFSDPVDLDVDF